MRKPFRTAILALTVVGFLFVQAAVPDTLAYKVYREASGDYFNVLGWMAGRLAAEVSGQQAGRDRAAKAEDPENGSRLVRRYVELNSEIAAATPRAGSQFPPAERERLDKLTRERDDLEPQAQAVLRQQMEEVLREDGFESSFAGRIGIWPPPLFAFAALPRILVVSPRDRIRTETTLALQPGLTWPEAEKIEERVSRLNLSALVVPIGGLGAYPPMIPRSTSLEFLAQTIPHEWMHNYLTFHPLGFRYSLQMETDYRMVTINESTASIVGEEVGDRILSKYYGYPHREHPKPPASSKGPRPQSPPEENDFAKRMRAIRLKVDDYLAKRQIGEAERYMAEEQAKLLADGYDVRKLNQAYFAFYGSYATSPGFTNPLGDAVAELRYRSPSLKSFVDRIGKIRGSADLARVLSARAGH
ncbi:MAG: hypothetical protein HYX94_13780 [Chloroflexi bacterium]|nr:hypothetical protein [Chloroflexota bacterium]